MAAQFVRLGWDRVIGRTAIYYRDDFASHRTVAEIDASKNSRRVAPQAGAGRDRYTADTASAITNLDYSMGDISA